MALSAFRDKLDSLQNILVSRATGGAAYEAEYRALRAGLLEDDELASRLPSFVRTCRDLTQFWNYIKKDRPHYEQRRQHIWDALAPGFEFAEFGNESEATRTAGSATMASELAPPLQGVRPRAFISYSTDDKAVAREVKQLLEQFGIEGFLAHEDIQVSEEWRRRILGELLSCDIFVPILSSSFATSEWEGQGLVRFRHDARVDSADILVERNERREHVLWCRGQHCLEFAPIGAAGVAEELQQRRIARDFMAEFSRRGRVVGHRVILRHHDAVGRVHSRFCAGVDRLR